MFGCCAVGRKKRIHIAGGRAKFQARRCLWMGAVLDDPLCQRPRLQMCWGMPGVGPYCRTYISGCFLNSSTAATRKGTWVHGRPRHSDPELPAASIFLAADDSRSSNRPHASTPQQASLQATSSQATQDPWAPPCTYSSTSASPLLHINAQHVFRRADTHHYRPQGRLVIAPHCPTTPGSSLLLDTQHIVPPPRP